jgi:hypothetical protein
VNDAIVSYEADFHLRLLTLYRDQTGALLFVADTATQVRIFLRKLMRVLYSLDNSSLSSQLSAQTRDGGTLRYEASSPAGIIDISLEGVPSAAAILIRETLLRNGSVPIVFGYADGLQVVAISPVANHVIQMHARIDGKVVSGKGKYDWNSLFVAITQDMPTVPLEAK